MRMETADICLILEGTYPYVSGGVSTWTHEMIKNLSDKTFSLMCILPPGAEVERKYDLPDNVIGISHVRLQNLPESSNFTSLSSFLAGIEDPLTKITANLATGDDYSELLRQLGNRSGLGYEALMEGEEAFDLIRRMYNNGYQESSFLDYFWSWRALMGSLFSISLTDLPPAHMYHTLSTGYAGMLAARAKIETGKPVILTEHGIYTNERRIEVASAEWLEQTASKALTIDHVRNNLRDFWADTFSSFSRICYDACDHIYTLFEGNKVLQLQDGAREDKVTVIPNGVEVERFAKIKRESHDRATVALIGRVVPIKDIKSFLRSVAMVQMNIPDVRVLVMGPTDEDADYYNECQQMVEYMGMQENVTFTGQVSIDKYLGQIDVLVLSSISEAMPLTILEAGAAAIPSVTTDVGACKEIIYGKENNKEDTALGDGGMIVPLSNPSAMAEAILSLLSDGQLREEMGRNMLTRVKKYYDKKDQISAYDNVYSHYVKYGSNEQKQAS